MALELITAILSYKTKKPRIAEQELLIRHRLAQPSIDARASFQQQFAQHHAMRLVRPYCISIQYCIH